ncbi:MAG TPA: glycosyltransferase family 87 protein [Candidatus Limnocylindrales bacterium]|nr:glycosyltransferase family 87 protein [Candidatus Limnocylindrales bacterium]
MELVVAHGALFFTVAALTPSPAFIPNHTDVLLYFHYAERLMQAGAVPYRDIPLEYPPLSLLPFVVPYLAWPIRPPTFETYAWLFAAQSAVLSAATALTVGWIGHRRAGTSGMYQAGALYTVMVVVMATIVAWRFDPFPALLAVGGVALAIAGMPVLAGAAIGLGFAAKVFPIVLLPVIGLAFIAGGRWRPLVNLLLGFVAAVGLVWLPIAVMAPEALTTFAVRLADRPIQIESVLGGLHLLANLLFGFGIEITRDFGSVNVHARGVSPGADLGGIATLAAMAGVFGLIYLRFSEEARRTGSVPVGAMIEASAAVLLALILTNKIFSPQYMIWLLPFAALLRRPQAYLVIAAAVLTMIIFPLNYERLIALEPVPIIVLNARNALLVILLALLLIGPAAPTWAGALFRTQQIRTNATGSS